MIVAAHQPHYLPWLGYLDKVARCDLFVVMDDLQYEAQNFQNRNRVKLAGGPGWLTVPLCAGPRAETIRDKRIQNAGSAKEHWARKHWQTLVVNYGKAPGFAAVAPALSALYAREHTSLLELDLAMLRLHLRWFGIQTPVALASQIGLEGQKSDRIVDLCRKVGASAYLSGGGGSKGYLDVEAFERVGVSVQWQEFRHPEYPQRYPAVGFTPYLAALDLVMSCGERSREILFGDGGQVRRAA